MVAIHYIHTYIHKLYLSSDFSVAYIARYSPMEVPLEAGVH